MKALILSIILISCSGGSHQKSSPEFSPLPDSSEVVETPVSEPIVDSDANDEIEDVIEDIIEEIPEDEKEVINYDLVASRDYSPSRWNNASLNFPSLTIDMPEYLHMSVGNIATGWVEVTVNETKYCYQGMARSNKYQSFVAKLKWTTDKNTPCHKKGKCPKVKRINDATSIEISVSGGGCNRYCAYTELRINVLELTPPGWM